MRRIHTLDLKFQGRKEVIAAFLVGCGADLALIETGPGSTLSALQEAVSDLGFKVADIQHVFVTHVHLDHAGAAGWFARQGATIYAHPRAVPHLVAPDKLMASATMVYGDLMEPLWGEMLPAPVDKVVALEDGQTVRIGNATFAAIDTPGHARHHHAFELVGEGICFTGDVAGVRLDGSQYLSVAAAPPQFDPVAYERSINLLAAKNYSQLYLTHYGLVTDVADHWVLEKQRVQDVYHLVAKAMAAGLEGDALRTHFETHEHALATDLGVDEVLWDRYQYANYTRMSADGVALYCAKHD